eukprot:5596483-Pleurochrysis_carterae.AAC.6
MCTDPTVLKVIAPAQPCWASPSCKASAGYHCYSLGFLFHLASSSPSRKPDANHACIDLSLRRTNLKPITPASLRIPAGDVRHGHGDYSNVETTLELRNALYLPGLCATLLSTKAMFKMQGIRTSLND